MHSPNHTLELTIADEPAQLSWQDFDHWIVQHFDAQVPPEPRDIPFEGPQASLAAARKAHALAWRAMALAAAWQRGARLPVLHHGRITACYRHAQDPNKWCIRLQVVHLRYLPEPLMRKVYVYATALAQKALQRPDTPQALQALYRQLHHELIKPLTEAMPLGKSTLHLLRTAQARNLPWQHLGNGLFHVGWGSQSTRFRHSALWNDSAIGTDTVQNKYWAAQWLAGAGLPVPQQRVVNTADQAVAAAKSMHFAVVIKPVNRDRGEGVCVRLTCETDVRNAFEQAQKLSGQVIVEAKIPGVCHRVLVVKGQVIYVVKRLPVAVQGNGKDSVRAICEQINTKRLARAPWLQEPLLPLDEEAQAVLASQGLTPDAVLPLNTWASLREIESTRWGGIDHDFTHSIHPENVALAIQAAQVVGLESAGVDIISPDIRVPWFVNGAAINEVNSAPTLGGGPVSLRTLDRVLDLLIPGNGRIPIHIFVGDVDALEAAQECHQALAAQGLRSVFLHEKDTTDANGVTIALAPRPLYERVASLLTRPSTDALVIHDNAAGPIPAVLPFDQISHLAHAANPLALNSLNQQSSNNAQQQRFSRLAALLPAPGSS